MGRQKKAIISSCGKNRRETGYYSTPKFIADFLAEKSLELYPHGQYVIDPCVGKEELLSTFFQAKKEITGIDIIDYGVHEKSKFISADFIRLYRNHKQGGSSSINKFRPEKFDYWIANPPYNCHEIDFIKNNKIELNKLFMDIGVHNMYSMFISAIIDIAKEGSIIALITFDSFLTSLAHNKLRKKILSKTALHYLILCPTDLFWKQNADVRTCLIILQKGKKHQGTVKVKNRSKNTEELKATLRHNLFLEQPLSDILLDAKLDNKEFIIDVPEEIKNLFKEQKRIGEQFKCITGISTGNDQKYLKKEKDKSHEIPFYKNPGSRKFFTEPDGYLVRNFLEVEREATNFMVRNKPLLFKKGITCSSMGIEFSACYLPENSAYGVNANIICQDKDIWWLLAFLNSELVSYIVRGVLIRTNMITSGYVSRIPIPDFDQECKKTLAALSRRAFKYARDIRKNPDQELGLINKEIYHHLNISLETRRLLASFSSDILRNT